MFGTCKLHCHGARNAAAADDDDTGDAGDDDYGGDDNDCNTSDDDERCAVLTCAGGPGAPSRACLPHGASSPTHAPPRSQRRQPAGAHDRGATRPAIHHRRWYCVAPALPHREKYRWRKWVGVHVVRCYIQSLIAPSDNLSCPFASKFLLPIYSPRAWTACPMHTPAYSLAARPRCSRLSATRLFRGQPLLKFRPPTFRPLDLTHLDHLAVRGPEHGDVAGHRRRSQQVGLKLTPCHLCTESGCGPWPHNTSP